MVLDETSAGLLDEEPNANVELLSAVVGLFAAVVLFDAAPNVNVDVAFAVDPNDVNGTEDVAVLAGSDF